MYITKQDLLNLLKKYAHRLSSKYLQVIKEDIITGTFKSYGDVMGAIEQAIALDAYLFEKTLKSN